MEVCYQLHAMGEDFLVSLCQEAEWELIWTLR
jgi:hypothetical protein